MLIYFLCIVSICIVSFRYFFDMDGGKKIRPTMVLGLSYALNAHAKIQQRLLNSSSAAAAVIESNSSNNNSRESDDKEILIDDNSISKASSSAYKSVFWATANDDLVATPSQKRLAEITEMIHTASLFHDDVIDKVVVLISSSSNIV